MDGIGGFPLLQESIERSGIRPRRQVLAVARGKLNNARPAFRSLHNAPDAGYTCVQERSCHDTVGRDHEVLNQLAGSIPLARVDSLHLAFGNYRLRLYAIYIERTQPVPLV